MRIKFLNAITTAIKLNIRSNFYKDLLLFLTLISSLNSKSQNKIIVTSYFAGNCNNIMILDNFVDSFCKKNQIAHRYILRGIKTEDLNEFSLKVFNKKISEKDVLKQEEIEQFNLKSQEPNWLTIICGGNVIKSMPIESFFEQSNIVFEINNCGQKGLVNTITQKPEIADSLELKIKNRIYFSGFKNNELSSYSIKGNNLFACDPLFEEKIVKINLSKGNTIKSDQFNTNISPKKIYEVVYGGAVNIDSLLKKDSQLIKGKRLNIESQFVHNNKLFLIGTYKFLTYNFNDKIFYDESHNIVLKYDTSLNFEDFYIEPFVSYSRMFPNIMQNSFLVNDSLLIGQFIYEINTDLKTKYFAYFRLHQNKIIKHKIDSVRFKENILGNFKSNFTGQFLNLGSIKSPVWTLYPTSLIYFKSDNQYLDILDTTLHWDTSNNLKLKKVIYNSVICHNKDSFFVSYTYKKNQMFGLLSIKDKKFIPLQNLGNLRSFGLNLIVSETGKLYCISNDENKIIYELSE